MCVLWSPLPFQVLAESGGNTKPIAYDQIDKVRFHSVTTMVWWICAEQGACTVCMCCAWACLVLGPCVGNKVVPLWQQAAHACVPRPLQDAGK